MSEEKGVVCVCAVVVVGQVHTHYERKIGYVSFCSDICWQEMKIDKNSGDEKRRNFMYVQDIV